MQCARQQCSPHQRRGAGRTAGAPLPSCRQPARQTPAPAAASGLRCITHSTGFGAVLEFCDPCMVRRMPHKLLPQGRRDLAAHTRQAPRCEANKMAERRTHRPPGQARKEARSAEGRAQVDFPLGLGHKVCRLRQCIVPEPCQLCVKLDTGFCKCVHRRPWERVPGVSVLDVAQPHQRILFSRRSPVQQKDTVHTTRNSVRRRT